MFGLMGVARNGGQGASAPASDGPAIGDGILLETGSSFLLLESGDFLLLE